MLTFINKILKFIITHFDSQRATANGLRPMALLTGLLIAFAAHAYDVPAGDKKGSVIGLEVADINREGDNIETLLNLDFSKVKLSGNTEVVITPMFVNGEDTVALEPLIVAGRNRWYWLQRNHMLPAVLVKGFGSDRGTPFERKYASPNARFQVENPLLKTYSLLLTTPYRDWMETAVLSVETEVRGCANCLKTKEGQEEWLPIAQNDFVTYSYFPEFLYVRPEAEAVKMREIAARAYIDFPVNRIEIYPDYRRNPQELRKIRATIDSIRNDKDITVKSLHISGTASPEGGYQNNVRLAKGRTEALKNYVQGLYHFPYGFITTSYEPVDWAGLAEFLEIVVYGAARDKNQVPNLIITGNGHRALTDSIRFDQFTYVSEQIGHLTIPELRAILPNAAAILSIVHSNIEPFERNNRIKYTYKEEYAWLLANVYPALRHSDYRIQFAVKDFVEPAEILEVMQSTPQKLSLSELFVAANSQPVGSNLYNRAFELAVTMFPQDETANLNAGNNAMARGDLISASRYLNNAGITPEADYARAILKLMEGDEEGALKQLRSLANSLNPTVAEKAGKAVEGLESVREANSRRFKGF